jgi:hypothetical protein
MINAYRIVYIMLGNIPLHSTEADKRLNPVFIHIIGIGAVNPAER